MRRQRGLSSEDRALWDAVARTLTPLFKRRRLKAAPEPAIPSPPPAPPKAVQAARPATPAKPSPPALPRLAPVERRLTSRLGRGSAAIDARIDLHGLTQHEAHERLKSFLAGAQSRGVRLALVITGKGGGEGQSFSGQPERGILRRLVPLWLSSPDLRPYVVGYDEAHRTHGGSGALYVLVRRRKG